MKKLIFIALLLLKIMELIAQQNDFKITLESDRILPSPLNSYIVKIIDARKNKTKIGMIHHKARNSNIIFKKNIADEFYSILAIQNDSVYLKKIILRINEISIDEIEEHSIASAFLNITFIEQKRDEFIELFTATEVVTNKINNLSKKSFLSDLIVQNFENCLKSFTRRYKVEKLINQKIDSLQLHQPKPPYTLPKLSNLKKGEYRTFYDFRDNTPDSIKGQITYKKSSTQNHELGILPLQRNQWGFFDGKKLFIKSKENNYFPMLEDRNRYIYYEKLSAFSYKKNENEVFPIIVTGGFIGGAIGGLIAAIAMNTNEKSKSQEEVMFSLNVNKGAFELTDETLDTESRVYIINSTFSTNPPLNIEINGKKGCSILATEYLKYYPKRFGENIKVCLNFENQEKVCETITLSEGERAFLMVQTNDGKKLDLNYKKEHIANSNLLNDFKNKEYTLGCSLPNAQDIPIDK